MSEASRPRGVSIVMPAFNLEGAIGANIDRTVVATAALVDPEIIVVDDGSVDATMAEAEAAAARYDHVTVVGHHPNRGKGAALRSGFRETSGAIVVFLDGDMDLPPEQVPEFVAKLEDSGVDALVGAKQEAMEPGRYPLVRRILSRTFAGTIKLLFRLPVSETQTGLKAFRREPLGDVIPGLRVMRYTYDLELLVFMHRRGYRIAEAPVELAEGASSGGVSVRTLWEMGRDTLRIWIRTIFSRR